jgi:hypothetical protein
VPLSATQFVDLYPKPITFISCVSSENYTTFEEYNDLPSNSVTSSCIGVFGLDFIQELNFGNGFFGRGNNAFIYV